MLCRSSIGRWCSWRVRTEELVALPVDPHHRLLPCFRLGPYRTADIFRALYILGTRKDLHARVIPVSENVQEDLYTVDHPILLL